MIQFAVPNKVYTTFSYDDTEILNAIGQMSWEQMGGQTFTALALETCLDTIQNYGRPGVDQYLLVLTDGASTNGLLLDDGNGGQYNIATAILQAGVTVFSVGVGSAISVDELNTIASNPDSNYVYQLEDFDALTNIRLLVVGDVCLRTLVMAPLSVPERPEGHIWIQHLSEEEIAKLPEEVCELCKDGPPEGKSKGGAKHDRL